MTHTERFAVTLCLVTFGCTPTITRPRIDGVAREAYRPGPTAVGQAIDVDFYRARFSGLAPAPNLQRHLQKILDRLLTQSPITDIPAHVHIRATSTFGAESSADANIYVNFRTLEELGSEDEVAAVLAHELAHVILRHPSSDVVEDVQSRLLTYTALALAAHGAIAQRTGNTTGLPLHTEALIAETLLLQLNQGVIGPAWVRAQEENADLLGLDLLVRAGYAPKAMETLLDEVIKSRAEGIDEQGFGSKVRDLFAQRWPELLQGGSDKLLSDFFKASFQHLVTWLKEDHPDPVKRKELVVAYRARNYAAVPDKDFDTETWRAIRKKDRATRALFQSYGDAIRASQLLVDKDTAGAMKLVSDTTTREMRDHTFVAEALYRVQNAAGARKRTAEQLFDPPVRGSEPAWLAFQELGFAQLALGKRDGGIQILERGFERLQRPPDAIGAMLYAYERTGEREKAAALARDCASRFARMASRGGCTATDPDREESPTARAQRNDARPGWDANKLIPKIRPPAFFH